MNFQEWRRKIKRVDGNQVVAVFEVIRIISYARLSADSKFQEEYTKMAGENLIT